MRAVAQGRGAFPGEVRQCSGKRCARSIRPFDQARFVHAARFQRDLLSFSATTIHRGDQTPCDNRMPMATNTARRTSSAAPGFRASLVPRLGWHRSNNHQMRVNRTGRRASPGELVASRPSGFESHLRHHKHKTPQIFGNGSSPTGGGRRQSQLSDNLRSLVITNSAGR